jgi:glycosyltransferase involved in cell wall biosynthesis
MTADTVGGVWGYSTELARALAPHGYEFVIATMGEPASADQRAEAAALGNARLVESRFRLEWMEDPWEDVDRAGDWLLALASDTSPDLVHLNGYVHAALPWSVPRLVVAHSCVFSWWRAVYGRTPPPEWSRYFHRVRDGIESADLLVAPSWAMLDAIRSTYGVSVPGRVIHNARSGRFRQSAKEPFVLSAGRLWDEAKNVAMLARVAPALRWSVRVAGDQKGRAMDGANVESLGQLTAAQLASQYSRASIYCLPARYEPFGLTVLEAALSGCALVLGDIASLRELWDGAAVFVSPDDENALQSTLARLIDDPRARRSLANAAAQRAAMFAPEILGRRYLAAYRELAGTPVEAFA